MRRLRDPLVDGTIISFRAAAILAVLIIIIRLMLLFAIQDRETLLLIDDLIFVIGSGLAAIGLLYGASKSIGRSRNAWFVMAISMIIYTIGDISWALIEAGLHQNPFPSISDVWYLAFYPVFALGIFLLPTEPLSSREKIKFLIDAGIVLGASVFLFWIFIIAPIVTSSAAIDFGSIISVAYPIMDLIVLAAMIELIFRKLSFAGSQPLFFLAFGVIACLIADVIFSIQTKQESYISSSLPDTLWLICYMFFFLAGIMQANSKLLSQYETLGISHKKIAEWAQYLPYLATGSASFLLIWGYKNIPYISYYVLIGFLAIMFSLAFVRQKVTLEEHNHLLATTLSQIKELNQADEALQESEERYHSVVDQASDIIFLYDLETRNLLEGNSAFHRLLGYSIEDMAELNIYDIVAHNRKSIDDNIDKLKKNKNCYIGRRNYRKKDGSLLDVEVYVNLIFFEHESILCSIARDVTERKLAEEALNKSEQEKAAILEGLKNVSVEYLDSQMRIVWLNSAVQKHLGLNEDQLKGKRCFEIIQGLDSPCPGCTALKAIQTAEPQEGELITPDEKIWLSHSNLIKDANGDLAGVVHVAVNITERKNAERALKESENMYRAIFENTGNATMIIEDNTIVSLANSELERLSGYSKEEIEGKRSWTEFVLKEDLERMLGQHNLRRIAPGQALNSYDFRAIDKNGSIKDILLRVDAIPGTKKSIASLIDITDRKRIEEDLRESKEQYKILAESSQDMIYVITRDDKVEYINGTAAKGLGLQPEDVIGRPRSSFFPPDIADRQKLRLKKVFDTGVPGRNEDAMIVGGEEIWQDTHLIPLKADDEIYAILGISRDITQHKQAEEMLKVSIAEKELLLKEVHHRVKNNLQIISTLFYLESADFTDKDILRVFKDSQDRIKSIALIHESLYKSHDLGKVDFSEYIKQLISYLSQSYGDSLGRVNFKVNAENIFLNINIAIPCGMIINELISNSLKHAFPNGRIGEIRIDICSEDKGFKLVISDNGIGFMDEANIKESKTLGFQLVETLVKQIEGTMRLEKDNGTKYEIQFSDK